MRAQQKYIFTVVFLAFLIMGCGVISVFGEQYKAGEYRVKAAFLYNFINFVEWPPQSLFQSSPTITLCIVGDDPIRDALNELKNDTVRGKKLTIKYRSADDIRGCNILFVPASEKHNAAKIVRSVGKSDVLTVSDTEETAQQGIIINFFIEQKKVRFTINIDAARLAGLKISAKLLKLAKIFEAAEGRAASKEY